ncbi:MFS transporter [Labrys okinawensis]|uniref:MFS transporter n=1 Tax=Labrys okinawensis TaxID=346911 RepID=UPI0039BCE71D
MSVASASTEPVPYVVRGSAAYRKISFGLFLAGFATFSLIYCVQPLLPLLAAHFEIGAAQSSLALSLTTGLLALAIFVAAAVSESLGRRELMFASIGLASLLNIAAAVTPAWHAILVIRALEGLALGGVPAVAIAYLAEEIEPRGLGFAMGLYIAGTAFGGMAGRVATGFLAEFFSWRFALGGIGAMGLVLALGFIALLPPSRHFTPKKGFDLAYHAGAWASHFRDGGTGAFAKPMLFAIAFCTMGSFVTIYNYAGFRLMAPPFDLGPTQTGLIFTVYLFGIASSSLGGAAADRFGRAPVLIVSLVLMAAGVGLTVAPHLLGMIAGIAVLTGGFFAAHAVASGWVGRLGGASKGHAASLYMLAYYLGSSIAGSTGGWFWSEGAWPAVAGFTLVLITLAIGCAARLGVSRAGG